MRILTNEGHSLTTLQSNSWGYGVRLQFRAARSGKVALKLGLMPPPSAAHSCPLEKGKAGSSSRLKLPKGPSAGKAISLHKLATPLDQEQQRTPFTKHGPKQSEGTGG